MITDPEYDTWLLPLDRLAIQYAEASEAFDIFKLDAVHSDPGNDQAEAAAGEISVECAAIRDRIVAHLANIPDRDLVAAYHQTDASSPRAEALRVEMKRRDVGY